MAENITEFQGTLADFEKILAEEKELVVVKFGTTTCPPCKRLNQILPSIAKENPTVKFIKVEVDNIPEIGQKYGITSVPNTILFKENKQITSIVGLNPPQIKQAIAANK